VLATVTSSHTLATVSQPGYYDHQTVTVSLPGNLAPGTYYIGGIADYNNHVGESNESNNTYNVTQVTVTAPPQADLTEYVAVDKTTVAAGDHITIDAYDMNIGNAVSGASTAQIYLSTDSTITTSDTVLATVTSSHTLATVSQPGYYDHQTVTVSLPGNLAPGTYYIGGIADYNNHVGESNASNNTYNVVEITVPGSAPSTPAHDSALEISSLGVNSALGISGLDVNSSDIVTIKGTADAFSQIKLFDGTTSVGTVKAAADGTWSYTSSSAVSNTTHTYTAQELDSSGHVAATSGSAILGSTGSNTLTSTGGSNLFVGNGHPDTFVFASNFGKDVITDFSASGRSHDVIQFSKSVFDNFADVLSHATQSGHNVVIADGLGDSLTLNNVKLAALDKHDFHFA
jgi:hypothetical protein